jgi:uncharacterized membrane protein YdfJ with MMPL/SSD domain
MCSAMWRASSLTQPRSAEPLVCCHGMPRKYRPGAAVTPLWWTGWPSSSKTGNLERGGSTLVSADRHATILSVVLASKEEERIDDLVPVVEKANGNGGFAVNITGINTVGRDFTKVSEDDLSKGELQFGLPAALVVLLLVFGTLTGAAIPMYGRGRSHP